MADSFEIGARMQSEDTADEVAKGGNGEEQEKLEHENAEEAMQTEQDGGGENNTTEDKLDTKEEENTENEAAKDDAEKVLGEEEGMDEANEKETPKEDLEKKADVEKTDLVNKISISVKSQHRTSTLTLDPSTTTAQLRALVREQYGVLLEQVVLIWRGALLSDNLATLEALDIKDGDTVSLVVRFNPPSEEGYQPQIYLPSQYSRLGLNNIDFVSLQLQMQQQMQANPEMVREMLLNPLTQQLMQQPSIMADALLTLPQAEPMLNRNPDIFDMLNNPEVMQEMLEMSRDPEQLQAMIDHMPIIENSPYQDGIPMFTEPPQATPSNTTLLHMTSQHPEMLARMLDAPYFGSMLEGLVANPQWAHQMIVQNPLFLNNPLLKHQINHLLPHCLQQLQKPEILALLKDGEALKALMDIQQAINTLQQESPNLFAAAGISNTAQPGHATVDPSLNPDLNITTMPSRLNRGEIDPTTVMISQIISQCGRPKEGTKAARRREGEEEGQGEEEGEGQGQGQGAAYDEELTQMAQMGFTDRDINLQLLMATFGNIDAAVSQLLLQEQQA